MMERYPFELGPIRPVDEADSLLIRTTRGCPWNRCEFCVNYKDMEYYYLCRYYFAPPNTWPPATEPYDPDEAFTRPLADLHGKTLGKDWAQVDHGPIPRPVLPPVKPIT